MIFDRVRETTTSTGTSTITLGGAAARMKSFTSSVPNGTPVYYVVDDGSAAWEEGIGTFTGGGTPTLARSAGNVINGSQGAGTLVAFGAGLKTVDIVAPAELLGPIGGRLDYAVSTGSANAYTVTLAPSVRAYVEGMRVTFRANFANTGAATVNVNGLGAKVLRKAGNAALGPNDISVDQVVFGRYDQTTDAVHCVGIPALPVSSLTLSGIVELATTTEQLTGTDATRAATPDGVAAVWEKGSDTASATTVNLGEGGYFKITGTTTITGFTFTTDKAGRSAILEFGGALTLTHNATSLILPTAANIVTAAGDTCRIVSLGSGNFRVASFQRASGHPVVAPLQFTTYFESAEVTSWSVGTKQKAAHGFGVVPEEYDAILRCKTGEGGFSAGDEINVFSAGNGGGVWGGVVYADATDVGVLIWNSSWFIPRKDTLATHTINPANWALVFRAKK